MKRIKSGFTVVELLTVIAILALLVGILLPALTTVRNTAKEAKQKVQLTTIDMALVTFKNDFGDYPPSDSYSWLENVQGDKDYCGSQKLAEALLGWDLLGFHPDSGWRADGTNRWTYQGSVPGSYPFYDPTNDTDIKKRRGPYLELSTANAFRLGIGGYDGLFDGTGVLNADRFVLCDAFSVKKVRVVRPFTNPPEYVAYNAGTPILYFKANTSSKALYLPYDPPYIYQFDDNVELINLGRVKDGEPHFPGTGTLSSRFIEYILDPRVSTEDRLFPYRPDSYILISAGADGEYGTADDITNF